MAAPNHNETVAKSGEQLLGRSRGPCFQNRYGAMLGKPGALSATFGRVVPSAPIPQAAMLPRMVELWPTTVNARPQASRCDFGRIRREVDRFWSWGLRPRCCDKIGPSGWRVEAGIAMLLPGLLGLGKWMNSESACVRLPRHNARRLAGSASNGAAPSFAHRHNVCEGQAGHRREPRSPHAAAKAGGGGLQGPRPRAPFWDATTARPATPGPSLRGSRSVGRHGPRGLAQAL